MVAAMKAIVLFILLTTLTEAAFELPAKTRQAIVGVAKGWNSSHVTLHLYERNSKGAWQVVSKPWKGRLGTKGLAWGRGLHPIPSGATRKREGDRRAPAGVFSIGGAWAYDPSTNHHPNLSFNKITTRDLWVEDVNSPSYNQHIRLDHEPKTAWEEKQQMRQNDGAHALKLFIDHNVHPKPVPGAGSSIFFHIWRGGGSRATFGCTTMHENQLRRLVRWIDPRQNPVYILLPVEDYKQLRLDWQLP
jgi:L,D-peptidoglycan transpeptidase YkuD (ErfK/YbiS/YcfS/YnhG family)